MKKRHVIFIGILFIVLLTMLIQGQALYDGTNGPGIDNKYHEKIFKIFQTLSQPDESESTGIGLSVAKKIVELNQGRIWVESNPGEGSTFFFTLPKSNPKHAVNDIEK